MSRTPEVLWIGDVPRSWDVLPLKYAITYNDEVLPESTAPDVELNYIEISDVEATKGIVNSTRMPFGQAPSRARRTAQSGDVLVSTVRTYLRAIASVPEGPVTASTGFAVLRAGKNITSDFLRYLCLSGPFVESIIARSTGVSYPAINASELTQTRIPLPPISTQRVVSGFLDRETAKIDALIGKQEQLIATLREESDALWSAELQQLSERSPHMQLRRVIDSIVDGPFGTSLTSSHYSDDGARVIRLGNIGINEFRDNDHAYIPLDYARTLSTHEVLKGDVVVAGLGDEKMPLGRAALVPEIGPAIVKADCYRVRPNTELIRSDFLAWVLSAPTTRNQIALLARGATRARLNTSVIKEVELPIPSLADQASAVSRSSEHLARIDFLMSKAAQLSATLREYRSALITNAVTGKIDIREAV